MAMKELEEFGIKIDKKKMQKYKKIIRDQNKMRVFLVKDVKKYLKTKGRFSIPAGVRIKKICTRYGMCVWLVDGEKIRTTTDIDFTTGGHGFRYPYVPINEIWVDSATPKKEIDYTILHEFVEFNLMKNGMNYNDAHDTAAAIEIMKRNKKLN